MIKSLLIETVSKKLLEITSSGELQALRGDLEKNVKAILESAMTKFDVVSREEYDIQVELLKNSRIKLDVLKKEITRLNDSLDNA